MSAFLEELERLTGLKEIDGKSYLVEITDALAKHTGRPVISYITNFANPGSSGNPGQIHYVDKPVFSDLVESIPADEKNLDLIIHSPGGLAEATAQIVRLLRPRFDHIRVIVPHMAMSAATMLAMAGDEIWMDQRSDLGPIDPQVQIPVRYGTRFVPAQTILSGFDKARTAIEEGGMGTMRAFLPLLEQYDLSLFEICRNAQALAEELVTDWLCAHMVSGYRQPRAKAKIIARRLADHKRFKSHGRGISLEELRDKIGVPGVRDLRTDPQLQDLQWRLYCRHDLMFDRAPQMVKVFTSSGGYFLIKQAGTPPQPQPGPTA